MSSKARQTAPAREVPKDWKERVADMRKRKEDAAEKAEKWKLRKK